MGENSLGSTLLDTTDARFANALSATPLAARVDYATTYGMENAERSTVLIYSSAAAPATTIAVMYKGISNPTRNIFPNATSAQQVS